MNENIIELNNTLEKERLINKLLKIEITLHTIKKALIDSLGEYKPTKNRLEVIVYEKFEYYEVFKKIDMSKYYIKSIFINYLNREIIEKPTTKTFPVLHTEITCFVNRNNFINILECLIDQLEEYKDSMGINDIENFLYTNKNILEIIYEELCNVKDYVNTY